MKCAILEISPTILIGLLTGFKEGFVGHYRVIAHGLPEDAEFVEMLLGRDLGDEFRDDIMYIKIRSETFEDIPEGQRLPLLEPPELRASPDNINTTYWPVDPNPNAAVEGG